MSTVQVFGMRPAQSERVEADASATINLIRTHLPHFQPKVELKPESGWWTLDLPCPLGAEYQFSLYGYLNGERQISATRTEFGESRSHDRFWYSPMELADFRDDVSELERLFHERVRALMVCSTRIVESKGIVLLGYTAEYQSEAGWQRLGGISYLGLGFGIPFVGKKRVYTSPSIVSCAQA